MSGTLDALTEILTSSKPSSAKRPNSIWADSTSASGVAPPYFLYRRGSSEPALTPMRTGTPRSRHSRATSLISRSEEHTSELQSQSNLVCRLLLEKKKVKKKCGDRNRTTSSA